MQVVMQNLTERSFYKTGGGVSASDISSFRSVEKILIRHVAFSRFTTLFGLISTLRFRMT